MQEWGKKIPFQHSISCPLSKQYQKKKKHTLCLKLLKISLRFKTWRKFEGISWVKLYFEYLKCVSSSRNITCFSSLKSRLVSRTDCAIHWLRKLKSFTWVQRCSFCRSYPWELPIIYLHLLSLISSSRRKLSAKHHQLSILNIRSTSWSKSFHWCLLNHAAGEFCTLGFPLPRNVKQCCWVFGWFGYLGFFCLFVLLFFLKKKPTGYEIWQLIKKMESTRTSES